jgi:citrate synthase
MINEVINPGLEGVIAAQTRLSSVQGQVGQLIIGGFPVEELAGKATFEETIYLLWNDALPDATELAALHEALVVYRPLSEAAMALLRAAAVKRVPVIDALRMAASTLSLQTTGTDANKDALALIANFPTIVAAYWRLLNDQEPLAPRADLGHAANYLYMLFGAEPSPEQVRGLETYLNTVVDHGLNASTFTARVIISTQSDMISAIVGALGALKGPRHGGAPGPALDMVFEIGQADKAETYLRDKLERGERLMGFGHRIYKVRDPRAEVLSAAAEKFYRADGNMELYNLVRAVEEMAVRLLAEYKPGRKLQTNVEFYTALLLHSLNLPTELFTPTFAIGRVGGWTAHCFEQQQVSRIMRPTAVYEGPLDRQWVSIEWR